MLRLADNSYFGKSASIAFGRLEEKGKFKALIAKKEITVSLSETLSLFLFSSPLKK